MWITHDDYIGKRNDIRALMGVLTVHCVIGRHAGRLGIPYNYQFRYCHEVEEEETLEHLIYENVRNYRPRFFFLFGDYSEVAHTKLSMLISFTKTPVGEFSIKIFGTFK